MDNNATVLRGIAYLCTADGCCGLTGKLITEDREQFNIVGTPHHHDSSAEDHDDHHTCCYDDSVEILDLTISQQSEGEESKFVHVVRSGEDNFSLTSAAVTFYTDRLLVDDKADEVIAKFISPDAVGKGCSVCVGDMELCLRKAGDNHGTNFAEK